MEYNGLIYKLMKECDIYYKENIISREKILKKYLGFFYDQFDKEKKSVSFSLHTGSVCFDVIAVVAISLGILTYNMSNNDDILNSLSEGDMVIYQNSRYRWCGKIDKYGKSYFWLKQYGKEKSEQNTYVPEKRKYWIKPYYGNAKETGKKGVRKSENDREIFLAWLLDCRIEEVPIEFDVSVVIIMNREQFIEIAQNVKIKYNNGKEIKLIDIISASYYTSTGKEYYIGRNILPVLKITSKVSEARRLVLNKNTNKVIGLLATNVYSIGEESELVDLIRRKSLKFVHVMGTLCLELGESILKLYRDEDIFACTKQYLKRNKKPVKNKNYFTQKLNKQVENIIESEIHPIIVEDLNWSWEKYSNLKNTIFQIKQSTWKDKEEFILVAYSLLSLFTTSIFKLETLEKEILDGKINISVISPKKRLLQLRELSKFSGSMEENCNRIIQQLEGRYEELFERDEKEESFLEYIQKNCEKKVLIIVPKAYYIKLLNDIYGETKVWKNITCITSNQDKLNNNYDKILILGNISNRKFDLLKCTTWGKVDVLLYSYEKKLFSQVEKKVNNLNKKLNIKLGIIGEEKNLNKVLDEYDNQIEQTFFDFEHYIENINFAHLKRWVSSSINNNRVVKTEVKIIGTFITGEQIFFSKNYKVIVYNPDEGNVIEKLPEKVEEGDILIFVKRDNYTKNVVDFIYEELLKRKLLTSSIIKATQMSRYWKEVLQKYKDERNYSYVDIANELKQFGSSLEAMTVRQWLSEDSHIVGPRSEETMRQIAKLTRDKELLLNVSEYFESCKIVRSQRKEILKLIGMAITSKFTGNKIREGDILSTVYDNVDNLSESLEVDSIIVLNEVINIPINLANKPITEEVLM